MGLDCWSIGMAIYGRAGPPEPTSFEGTHILSINHRSREAQADFSTAPTAPRGAGMQFFWAFWRYRAIPYPFMPPSLAESHLTGSPFWPVLRGYGLLWAIK